MITLTFTSGKTEYDALFELEPGDIFKRDNFLDEDTMLNRIQHYIIHVIESPAFVFEVDEIEPGNPEYSALGPNHYIVLQKSGSVFPSGSAWESENKVRLKNYLFLFPYVNTFVLSFNQLY